MNKCQHCGSTKIIDIQAKCSDACWVSYPDGDTREGDGVPSDLNIGGGDYIRMELCGECGRVQGEFPLQNV